MKSEPLEAIAAFLSSSMIGNLLLFSIYSLSLIAASAWLCQLAYRKGREATNVQVDALRARQEDMLEQSRLSTTAIQRLTAELQEQFSIRSVRREKLESILRLIREHATVLSESNEIVLDSSQIHDGPGALKGNLRQARSSLIQLQSTAALYFHDVSRDTEAYVETALAIMAENWARVSGTDARYSTEETLANSRRLLAAERKYTRALLDRYARECGIEDFVPEAPDPGVNRPVQTESIPESSRVA